MLRQQKKFFISTVFFLALAIFYGFEYNSLDAPVGSRATAWITLDALLWIVIWQIIMLVTKPRSILGTITTLILFCLWRVANSLKLIYFGAPLLPGDLALGLSVIKSEIPILYYGSGIIIFSFTLRYCYQDFKGKLLYLIKKGVHVIPWLIILVFIASLPSFNIFHLKLRPGFHRKNAKIIGSTAYYLYLTVNHFKMIYSIPSSAEVSSAMNVLPKQQKKENTPKEFLPNIFLINVESLFDPLTEVNETYFSSDPFDPRFRDLFNTSGAPLLVSPRGGGSASTEFEILCGLPSLLVENISGVESATLMKQDVPCLPRLLKQNGYKTFGWYGYGTQYFNERSTFQKTGIDTVKMLWEMNIKDLDGSNAADSALFNEVWNAQVSIGSKQQFHYISTAASHFPFIRNDSRPDIISAIDQKGSDHLAVVNRIRYTTKEIMDFVERILKQDQNSLFVILGDHRPVKYFPRAFDDASTVRAQSTVVVFSRNWTTKPWDLRTLASYEIPRFLLKEAGLQSTQLLDFAAQPPLRFLRTATGLEPFMVNREGRFIECWSKTCPGMREQEEATKTIIKDVLFGHQYSLGSEAQRP